MEEEKETKPLVPEVVEPEVVDKLPAIYNEAQKNLLQRSTPQNCIFQREGRGGLTFNYVKTYYVVDQLNQIFGYYWDFEILDETAEELALKIEQVKVKGKLTAKTISGKQVSKVAYGSSEVKFQKDKEHIPANLIDLADDYKSAASDCLKKCASLLGVAIDVYSGEHDEKIDKSKCASCGNETSRGDIWYCSFKAKQFYGGKVICKDCRNKEKEERLKEVNGEQKPEPAKAEEKPTEEKKPANNLEKPITEITKKSIWASAKQAGLDEVKVHAYVKQVTGKEHVSEITEGQGKSISAHFRTIKKEGKNET